MPSPFGSYTESEVARLIGEGLIELIQAARRLGVSSSVAAGWMGRGRRGLYLESVPFGGLSLRTTAPAVERFLARWEMIERALPGPPPPEALYRPPDRDPPRQIPASWRCVFDPRNQGRGQMSPHEQPATVEQLIGEEVWGLAKAARMLKTSPGRVRSWAKGGKAGVILETFPLGRRLMTTREAVARFLIRLEQATRPVSYPMPPRR